MQEVIEAITTCAVVDGGLGAVLHHHRGGLGGAAGVRAGDGGVRLAGLAVAVRERAAGSEAGKVSSTDSSTVEAVSAASSGSSSPSRGVGRQRLAEGLLGVGQRDPVLRALRAGDRRDDGGQVQLQVLGVGRLAVGVVPQALGLGVGLDQRDLLGGAAGELQVGDGLVVDREDRRRWSRTPGSCCRWWRGWPAGRRRRRRRRTRRTCRPRRACAASR